jgi:predicted deacetylase
MCPSTLDRGRTILERLAAAGVHDVAVLVMPGVEPWDDASVAVLQELSRAGYPLVAHGWSHHAPPPRTAFERVHSAMISQDAAEHFGKDGSQVLELMRRSHAWFAEHGLPSPRFYVPPAWAVGRLPRKRLAETPFDCVETLDGFYDTRHQRGQLLPLLCYEAVGPWQAAGLRATNLLNMTMAKKLSRPLRISVHPRDFELLLSSDLERLLEQETHPVSLYSFLDRELELAR